MCVVFCVVGGRWVSVCGVLCGWWEMGECVVFCVVSGRWRLVSVCGVLCG